MPSLSFGQTLQELRKSAGYSQQHLAEAFTRKGNPVSNQAISKWEKDCSLPNALQFLTLCEIYGGAQVMSAFLSEDSSPISLLNREGRQKVLEYIDLLNASGRYQKKKAESLPPSLNRTFRLYCLPVSAGTGQQLFEEAYEEIVPSVLPPADTDFCLRISGDSMEPQFHNGQIVFVHSQPVLNDGDIGIFAYDGNAYCKKLSLTTAGIRLVSLNPAYAPITVPRDAELTVFGKVVGKD